MRLHDYLTRVGLPASAGPTLDTLRRLHVAHREAFLFENISIQTGGAVSVAIEDIERKFLDQGRGGYCFEHNTLFAAALEAVGFGVTRLGARVRFGARGVTARTHMALLVETDGEGRLADVGFGGGSILGSLPIGTGPEVDQFGWRFRLVDDDGARVLQTRRPKGWIDLYSFTFEPQYPVDEEMANHFTSTHPSSPFTRTLTAQLCAPERSLILRGRKLIEETPTGETASEVRDDELLDVLAERFTLSFPPGTRFDASRAGS